MHRDINAPRFSTAELWELEEDARAALLNEDGALNDPGKWLGHVIDLARGYRSEVERRLHG